MKYSKQTVIEGLKRTIEQQVIVDGITHLINVEKTVQKMIEAGYLNLDLFEKIYKEVK